MSAPLETAVRYIRRGWNPVPIPFKMKGPQDKGWQDRIIREEDASRFFNGLPQNIGVILGPSSNGLTDVDLDCSEAIELAPYFLPRTDAIFGRLSKPRSHYLYRTQLAGTLNTGRVAFTAPRPEGGTIIELRVGGEKGAQTVFPGSVHESGEPIEWDKSGDPAAVDGGTLQRAVRTIAAAALLARFWPKGQRHYAALALGGELARIDATPEAAERLITAVAKVAKDEEEEDRVKAVKDGMAAVRAGEPYARPNLAEFFGQAARKIEAWLGLRAQDEQPQEGEVPPRIVAASPFVWIDEASIPARQWLYSRHYIRDFVSVTVAPGGVGKSSLGIVEALAMASGKPLLGIEPQQRCKVWLWNGEDPKDEMLRRVMAAAQHFELTREDLEGWLFLDSGRDMEIAVAGQTRDGVVIYEPVRDAVIATVQQNGIDVVIIDPFVSSHRVTENDNNAIDRVAKLWSRIAGETGCAIELVHHSRKTGGAEVSVEDGRGASALLAAARSARVLNAMTEQEADNVGVEHRRLFFRVDNGKSNLAPPPDKATWHKIVSVQLMNGDAVGVVTAWKPPDPFEDVSVSDLRKAQSEVNVGGYRLDVQSPDWVGHAIARALDLDLSKPGTKAKVKGLLKTWTERGMFRVVEGKDAKGNYRKFVEVGEWATD